MEPFDVFLSDDRRTVSDGPTRKLKFPPTGLNGSKSDNGDKRHPSRNKEGDSRKKGVISQRTSKMAQHLMAPSTDQYENDSIYQQQQSRTASTRSSYSASPDAFSDYAPSRSQQVADMMEVASKIKYIRDSNRLNDYVDSTPPFLRTIQQQQYQQHQAAQQNYHLQLQHNTPTSISSSSLGTPSSMSSARSQSPTSFQHLETQTRNDQPISINSVHGSTNQQIYRKLHPMSPSHTLDPLACESRDSEEELRLAVERNRNNLNPHELEPDASIDDDNASLTINTEMNPSQFLKVILVGDSRTGKSSLLKRRFENNFDRQYSPTRGVDNRSENLPVQGRDCKFQLWDISGAKETRAMMNTFFKGANCFGLVYDITDYSTVESIPVWIQQVKECLTGNIPIVLIGNKLDCSAERIVGSDSVQQYAIECGLQGYIEVSALSGMNIQHMIDLLAFLAYERVTNLSPIPVSPTATAGLSCASEDALLTRFQRQNSQGVSSPLPQKRPSDRGLQPDQSVDIESEKSSLVSKGSFVVANEQATNVDNSGNNKSGSFWSPETSPKSGSPAIAANPIQQGKTKSSHSTSTSQSNNSISEEKKSTANSASEPAPSSNVAACCVIS